MTSVSWSSSKAIVVGSLWRTRWLHVAGALLITGAGFAIRAHHLEVDSLWIDEMITERTARADLPLLLGQRDHPPLWYLLSRLSLNFYGEGAFALRLPSLLAGTLALPLIYRMGKEIGRPGVGLWSALLLALTPFHVRHAQEARHYALLLTLTLATYLLLYRGLKRPKWQTWLLFSLLTVVNLYTHYAALIVLLSQSILIGIWLAYHLAQGRSRLIRFPAGSAALVVLLYLPWLPRLVMALQANVGENSVSGQGLQVAATVDLWFRVAFAAFTPASALLQYLLPALFLVGIALLLRRRSWLSLALLGTGLVLPLLLLYLFPISREPYSRYVIYTLPFFLLPAGLGLAGTLHWLRQRQQAAGAVFAALTVILLLLIYPPLLQAEYEFVRNDWVSVQNYLTEMAEDGDVLLGVSLSFPNGYNHVTTSFPYYLERDERQYLVLDGSNLSPAAAEAVASSHGQVWALFSSGGRPIHFEDPAISIVPFQTDIFLARNRDASEDAWAATVELYRALLPLAAAPAPQCYMHLDLAALYTAREQYEEASTALERATEQCPVRAEGKRQAALQCAIVRGKLEQQVMSEKQENPHDLARALVTCDRKDPLGLEILTWENLLDRFEAGAAQIQEHNSPEPVTIRTFTMPENGDWGEVLFIHPPAAVSFSLKLPQTRPVSLQTRVALDPQSRSWGGDGVTFVVDVARGNSGSETLFRDYVQNDPADQGWHDVGLSLAPYAGQTITLTFRTEAGPAGDMTGDWAGWETPRLLWEPFE